MRSFIFVIKSSAGSILFFISKIRALSNFRLIKFPVLLAYFLYSSVTFFNFAGKLRYLIYGIILKIWLNQSEQLRKLRCWQDYVDKFLETFCIKSCSLNLKSSNFVPMKFQHLCIILNLWFLDYLKKNKFKLIQSWIKKNPVLLAYLQIISK